ncbi:MAG: glycosyltransferase family 2 protein [Bacteroidota bacterium]|jgi:glycosyltransferase involved in cell wall biosynthesis
MPPSVSVIMPVYNAANWLPQSVSSILAQTLTNWELIIVNDGSADGSAELLAQYNDPRIRVLHQANAGVSAALNKALEYCSAPYIARLDADDVALPERLQKEADYLDQHPQCALVGAAAEKIDRYGNHAGYHRHPCSNMRLKYGLLWDCYFVSSTVMFRRSCLEETGMFYNGSDLFDDYSMWSVIAERHNVANLPDVLLQYRILETGLSHTTSNAHHRLINQRKKNMRHYFPELTAGELEALAHCGFKRTKTSAAEVKKLYRLFLQRFATGPDAGEIATDLKERFTNLFRILTPAEQGAGYILLRPVEKLLFHFLLRA